MHSKREMTTEERVAILDNFGGEVRTSLIEDGHAALPNHRAQYIISTRTAEFTDTRMTGWGINDDSAIECLYRNIRSLMWNMVVMIE